MPKTAHTLMMVVYWIVLVVLIPPTTAFSTGAPANRCNDLTPQHPGKSLPLDGAPYRISLSTDVYVPFQVVRVTIEADEPFSGFLLQARDADNINTVYVGQFQPTDSTKYICGQHGLTHTSPTLKDSQTFTWRAPLSGSTNVIFRVTVVKNYFDYYVDIRSDVLRPMKATTTTNAPTTTEAITTTITSSSSTTTTTTKTTPTTSTPLPPTTIITTKIIKTTITETPPPLVTLKSPTDTATTPSTTTTATATTTTAIATTTTTTTTKLPTNTTTTSFPDNNKSSSASSDSPKTITLSPTSTVPSSSPFTTSTVTRVTPLETMTTPQHQIDTTHSNVTNDITSYSSTKLYYQSSSKLWQTSTSVADSGSKERNKFNNTLKDQSKKDDDDVLQKELSLYLPLAAVLVWAVVILVAAFHKFRMSRDSGIVLHDYKIHSLHV